MFLEMKGKEGGGVNIQINRTEFCIFVAFLCRPFDTVARLFLKKCDNPLATEALFLPSKVTQIQKESKIAVKQSFL